MSKGVPGIFFFFFFFFPGGGRRFEVDWRRGVESHPGHPEVGGGQGGARVARKPGNRERNCEATKGFSFGGCRRWDAGGPKKPGRGPFSMRALKGGHPSKSIKSRARGKYFSAAGDSRSSGGGTAFGGKKPLTVPNFQAG